MVVGAEHETGHRRLRKRHPDIHVVWKNTSGYDKLNNAIQDGYGIPDVVQLEYYALRQYAVSSQLVPITGRTEGYADFYTPGTWASVQLNGRVYGLPMDSGPMAFFYNNSVFEQVGVDASKIRTWDDYYEAAKKSQENRRVHHRRFRRRQLLRHDDLARRRTPVLHVQRWQERDHQTHRR